jgi:1-deoxy-D-xylulose-5-phosphate reductoisomerase
MAGELVTAAASQTGARLLPVDSEMSALVELLRGTSVDEIARLILTASGGPFRDWPTERIASATVAEAVAHPTWRMGRKISVDSATMANKGLEIIEAHHLFCTPADRIDVLIHPQSVVHSLVELIDGGMVAQLAVPDMRLPIGTALECPRRAPFAVERLDLSSVGRLDFEAVDPHRFPALGLARDALSAGGVMPVVFNAANEIAVEGFLDGRCSFGAISGTIAAVMESWGSSTHRPASLEEVFAVDAKARRAAGERLGNTAPRFEVPTE